MYEAVKLRSHTLEVVDGAYTNTFRWELLGGALLQYLPAILALAVCLVGSVSGLILIIKRKGRLDIVTVCVCAVMAVAGGVLICVFAHPNTSAGLALPEYMSYRYFMGMELNIDAAFPFLQAAKYTVIGLTMVLSGGVCGLGIAEMTARKRSSVGRGLPDA